MEVGQDINRRHLKGKDTGKTQRGMGTQKSWKGHEKNIRHIVCH